MPAPLTHLGPRKSYIVLLAIIWVVLVAVIVAFRTVLLPFAGALLVAYVIAPLVSRLTRLGFRGRTLPRWGAILGLYAAFFGALYLFVVAAAPQLYREAVRISVEGRLALSRLTPAEVAEWARAADAWLENRGIPIDLSEATRLENAPPGARINFDAAAILQDSLSQISEFVRTHIGDVIGWSRQLVTGVFEGVFVLLFVLVVAAFVLLDPQALLKAGREIVPAPWRADYDELLGRIDEKLAGVVRGQLVICLINGTLTLIGLAILHVKFALLLAIVAAVLSFIPIFGTIVSTVPIVLVGLTQSWQTGLLALAWILLIHALEAYVLNPRILGRATSIHPALIAFALLAGERTYGLPGALFAVPVAAIVIATLAQLRDRAHLLEEASPELSESPAEPGSGSRTP